MLKHIIFSKLWPYILSHLILTRTLQSNNDTPLYKPEKTEYQMSKTHSDKKRLDPRFSDSQPFFYSFIIHSLALHLLLQQIQNLNGLLSRNEFAFHILTGHARTQNGWIFKTWNIQMVENTQITNSCVKKKKNPRYSIQCDFIFIHFL